jgi:hypothetical protein
MQHSDIGCDAILGSGFKATGNVNFTSAKIGGSLDTDGATYDDLIIEGTSVGEP